MTLSLIAFQALLASGAVLCQTAEASSTYTDHLRRLMADMTSGVETATKAASTSASAAGATAATSSGNTAPSPPANPTPAASAPRSPLKCC